VDSERDRATQVKEEEEAGLLKANTVNINEKEEDSVMRV